MVQLSILTGNAAGNSYSARRFPFTIGRAAGSDLRLEEPGVWDNHAKVRLERQKGFIIEAGADALLRVNGEPCESAALRNGDTLEIGSVKARFWLAPAAQRPLRPREILLWSIVGAVSAAQVGIIYWLLD